MQRMQFRKESTFVHFADTYATGLNRCRGEATVSRVNQASGATHTTGFPSSYRASPRSAIQARETGFPVHSR